MRTEGVVALRKLPVKIRLRYTTSVTIVHREENGTRYARLRLHIHVIPRLRGSMRRPGVALRELY